MEGFYDHEEEDKALHTGSGPADDYADRVELPWDDTTTAASLPAGDFRFQSATRTTNVDVDPNILYPTKQGTKDARREMKKVEETDLHSSLEHIFMIGNNNRHKKWRKLSWKQRVAVGQTPKTQQSQQEPTYDDMPELKLGVNQHQQVTTDNHMANQTSKKRNISSSQTSSAPPVDDEQTTTSFTLVHAADVRIYGKKYQNNIRWYAKPWPRGIQERKSSKGGGDKNRTVYRRYGVNEEIYHGYAENIDDAWNLEHGDSIQRLHFTDVKLAKSNVASTNATTTNSSAFAASVETEKLLDASRIKQLDPDRMRNAVQYKDVPRAMLLRCWQRAVDAATTSTLQPQTKSLFADDKVSFRDLENVTAFQQEQIPASQRCYNLTVDMFPKVTPIKPPYRCRNCGNSFEERDKLREHFHGNNGVRGCCWSLIYEKQRKIIADLLQKEVSGQADSLLHLVFSEISKQRLEHQNDNKNDDTVEQAPAGTNVIGPPDLINWEKLLELLENQMKSAHDTNALSIQGREITKSLAVHKELAPLVLNKQVLEAASERILDRYVDVPK